jgi:cytidylate kinase
MPKLYILTGPAGVGKSTISNELCYKSGKSACIEGDDIYHLVKVPYVSPWMEGNHLEIFWENCIDLINNFLEKDYDVVFNYIINKKDLVNILNNIKVDNVKTKFVNLMVDEDTIIKRDNERQEDCRMGERSIILLNSFKNENYNSDNILDTSNLSIEETVNEIIYNDKYSKLDY